MSLYSPEWPEKKFPVVGMQEGDYPDSSSWPFVPYTGKAERIWRDIPFTTDFQCKTNTRSNILSGFVSGCPGLNSTTLCK